VLRIPAAIFHQYVTPDDGEILARRISREDPLGSVIHELLMKLWNNRVHFDDSGRSTNICNSILSLLATQLEIISPGTKASESSVRAAHRQRIKQYMEQHLANPSLSPGMIGKANGLSPRYLRLLFESEGITYSRYINQRRLEQVARDLANPLASHYKITELAYRWGFNNQSYFSRAFKVQFHCSAQHYRQVQLVRNSNGAKFE